MIKAEDLRIGDLVNFHNSPCIITGIDDISCTVGLLNSYNSEDFRRVDDINIEPIPLTPEILEKNGWKRDKLVSYIYGHEAHFIEVICTPNSEWVYVTFKGETIHRIKYVHELQHILWALGLDANLKI